MNIRSSLKVMLLALAVSAIQADRNCCTDLCDSLFDTANWYVTGKIGVAPSIFAGSRSRQQFVVPFAALNEVLCNQDLCPGCIAGQGIINNFANTLQEGPCLPKFSDMFRQGVLHVGVEVGYQGCDSNCPIFLEFVYNRARGRCVSACDPFVTNTASLGCSRNCNSSSNCNNNCTTTGTSLSNICGFTDDYSHYTAFGGYIGGRHFTCRFWCDTTAFWFGYKVGILHRRHVNSCSTLVIPEAAVIAPVLPCSTTQNSTFERTVFCKSNSVSGGVQIGLDYEYSDCLAFQLGFEVVASCGLRGNRNHTIDLTTFKDPAGNPLINVFALPSNILVRDTGTVVNFPIWFGVRWEFGSFCNPCCDTAC